LAYWPQEPITCRHCSRLHTSRRPSSFSTWRKWVLLSKALCM
jgi:hypothetical protein